MTQVEKILLKLDKELTEKSYCNCNTEAGTIQVSEGANIWSGEVFYSVDYVELDNSEYVLHATHIDCNTNLLDIAQYLYCRGYTA